MLHAMTDEGSRSMLVPGPSGIGNVRDYLAGKIDALLLERLI